MSSFKWIFLILGLFCLPIIGVLAQTSYQQTYNNYTGSWESSSSWNPTWTPQTTISGVGITIYGYISAYESISFTGASANLYVNDTLVIYGNLTIDTTTTLDINSHGIIIVWGNLYINNNATIYDNDYLIVTGNIIKGGSINDGTFIRNSGGNIYMLGSTVPLSLTDGNSHFPALNCNAPTNPYSNSGCSYGNLNDLINDPIYPFFESTCQTATPTITATGPTTFCSGDSVTLTSSSGTSYLWSNGKTSQSIIAKSSGNYTVKVTNANGCQSASSIATVVTVNSLPSAPTITTNGPTIFCKGGNVKLTSSPGLLYFWTNGMTTQNITVDSAGIYRVMVKNANGCQSPLSAGLDVFVNYPPPAPTITPGGLTTFCDGDSVILASSSGSTYLWSNGLTSQSINVKTSGEFTVSVTGLNGCQSSPSDTTVVTVNALPVTPTITARGPTVFCQGGNVTLISSNGAGYLWSNGTTSDTTNVNESGPYSVKIFNANGCMSAWSVAKIVTVNSLPLTPVITASSSTTFCEGGSVTLTSSGSGNYLWSNGSTDPNINVTKAGNYFVQIKDINGCQSSTSDTTVVKVNTLPVVNTGSNISIPNGTNTTLTATVTGTAPFTYLWTPSAELVNDTMKDPTTINLSNTTIFTLKATSISTSCSSQGYVTVSITGGPLTTTPSATPVKVCAGTNVQLKALAGGGSGTYSYNWTSLPAGFTSILANPIVNPLVNTTYYINVSDGFNIANSQVLVTVNPLPVIPTITADSLTTFCEGGSVRLTSNAGTGNLWSNGDTMSSIIVTNSGHYTVKVTNSFGCQSDSSTTTVVTVNSIPTTPIITPNGSTTFCKGDSVTLISSKAYKYLWSTGDTTNSINIDTSNSYFVKVTNLSGCQSANSVPTIVTVNQLPTTPDINVEGSINFCEGDSVILTSSEGNSYIWSNGETTKNINITKTGSYFVQVTNTNGCLSDTSLHKNVTVDNLPAVPVILASGSTNICEGDSVKLTSSEGIRNLWSTNDTTSSIYVTNTGNYTVRITNLNGCQSKLSSPLKVTVNEIPTTPTITSGGPTTFCEGDSVKLTSSYGNFYLWSDSDTTESIIATKSGNYYVKVKNANGCISGSSVEVTITVNALPFVPTITADGTTTFCYGDSVGLISSTGSSYLWSNGSTSPSINITLSGNYTVKITDINGCQSLSSQPEIVTVNPLPAVKITSSDSSLCINDLRLLTANPAGGTFKVIDGPGIVEGNNLSASNTGGITLVYSYSNGCSNKDSQLIIVNPIPLANAGPNQDLTFVFQTNLEAELILPETGYWSLSSGTGLISDIHSPSTFVSDLSLGDNSFLWKVQNGHCEADTTVHIIVHDLFVPSVITPNGDGKNDYFKLSEGIGQVELIIIDKWGNEEYSNNNYSNNWDGKNNQGMELPNDTYFYLLKFSNGRVKKGYILIKR